LQGVVLDDAAEFRMSGAGSCLPLMVVVALGEPRAVPVTCCGYGA
jgi:hypothetical protein